MNSTPTSLRLFWLLLILDKGELRFSLEILPLNSFSSCCTLSSVSPLKTNTSVMSSVSKWLEYPILMAVSGNKIQNVKKITTDTWDHRDGLRQKSSTRRRFFSFYSLLALSFPSRFRIKNTDLNLKNVTVDEEKLSYDSNCSQSALHGCFTNAKFSKTDYFTSFRRFCVFDYWKVCHLKNNPCNLALQDKHR